MKKKHENFEEDKVKGLIPLDMNIYFYNNYDTVAQVQLETYIKRITAVEINSHIYRH